MSGLRIACLYSLPPHKLGFCGPLDKRKTKVILDCIRGKKIDELRLRKILKEFIGAVQYYQLIAQANKIKDPFNQRIVKAYWVGNQLLAKFKKVLPHHSYHVLMVGSVTGRIKFNDKLRDLCRIGWGRVTKIKNQNPALSEVEGLKLIVRYQPLVRRDKRFVFGKIIKKEVEWDKDFIPEIKIGDMVSLHWNQAIEILSQREVKNLKKYTQQTLNLYVQAKKT